MGYHMQGLGDGHRAGDEAKRFENFVFLMAGFRIDPNHKNRKT